MPYLGKTPSQATRKRYYKTASAGDTSVSGTMTVGGTLTFTDGEFVDVSVNGVALVAGTDYNTNTANTIAGLSALAANDQVEIVVYDTFSVFSGDVDSNLSVGGNLSVTGTATLTGNADFNGDLDVDGTTNLDVVDIDGAVDMASTLQVDGAITSSAGATITTADNTVQLTLKSTDADANVGPILDMIRDSSSPADGDEIGRIRFKGDDDAGNETTYAFMQVKINDATDASDDGELEILTRVNGSSRSRIEMFPSETVLNEDSQDIDFRVEGNGNANMFFVDAGNDKVGVGTNTPAAIFSALSTSGTTTDIGRFEAAVGSYTGTSLVAGNTLGAASSYNLFKCISDSDADAGGPVTHFLVRGDGNVGINTDSPTLDSSLAGLSVSSNSTLLHINDTDGACLKLSDPASGANRGLGIALQGTSAVISNCESGELRFGTGNTERARFDSSGRFMVGANDANSAQLTSSTSATGEFAADLRSTSSSYTSIVCLLGSNTNTTNSTYDHLRCDIHGVAQKLAIRDSGNVVNANNSYGSLSDSRMKENIVDAASQWDDIKALQVRKYNRIGETQKELGVIAQELEASGMGGLVEEARYYDVNNNPDEETRKSVKYSVLYMKAVKALQEAMTRIETLETQNTTQVTQIADLITRVNALEAGE